MEELKGIESYSGPTALLLSSSIDKIARAPEKGNRKERQNQNPDQGRGNRTRYLMKRAGPGTTSPPAKGEGIWTRYLMKRAGPETMSPPATGKGIPSCYPMKRATPRTTPSPAPGRVHWSRYLMKRAFPGTHAPRRGKEATTTETKAGGPGRTRTSRQGNKLSRINNYRRHPQATSRPISDQLQWRQRGGEKENATHSPQGTRITNMETPNSGNHYHKENIADVIMSANTGAFHDELFDEAARNVICIQCSSTVAQE